MCTISETKITTVIHHRGEAVDEKPILHLRAADARPFVDGGGEARAIERDRLQTRSPNR